MKAKFNDNVTLLPLQPDDREQFILDNQRAFKYGASEEFGLRDDHFEEDGEIISRATIEASIDGENAEAYRILLDGEKVGGAVISVEGGCVVSTSWSISTVIMLMRMTRSQPMKIVAGCSVFRREFGTSNQPFSTVRKQIRAASLWG